MESDYSNKYKILCLLHELRIVSRKQIIELFNISSSLSSENLRKHLKELRQLNMIKAMYDHTKQGNPVYFYLTQLGYNSIGGYYSLPKVPEYNLQHHLQINDYLIKMLKICEGHPHLNAVISERRQVYETKDFTKKTKGKKGKCEKS